MATELKHVLLHFTEEEHSHLSEMKKKMKCSWEQFLMKLSHGEIKEKNTKGEKTK